MIARPSSESGIETYKTISLNPGSCSSETDQALGELSRDIIRTKYVDSFFSVGLF